MVVVGGFGKRRLCVCTFRGLCLCLRGLARPECTPTPTPQRPLGLCSFSTSAASSFHFPRPSLSQVNPETQRMHRWQPGSVPVKGK